MALCLGIDTGGTYTDAVIVDDDRRRVLKSVKSLTTYPDPIGGIRNALDFLPLDLLEKVTAVSVSTTLSTNTVLENTGDAAALILIGDKKLLETDEMEKQVAHFTIVSGGHNSDGNETECLDISAIEEYVSSVKDKVSAFAVSSYFSVRNPAHELKAKEIIMRLTSGSGNAYPVICGHELAQSLGAYERGVTAYLNATLLPVTKRFVNAVVSEIKCRGLNADVKILKCNGAVSGIEEAMERPVESVFSGPVASLLGASFLSEKDSCLMVDVGGTSTDVSLVENGFPDISDNGAVVGGRKTKVRAIRVETSALGGDSQIWVRNPSLSDSRLHDKLVFGPRRIIPLCRAASLYPSITESLKERWFSDKYKFSEYVQPTLFFIRSGHSVPNLTPDEKMIYAKIKETPVSLNDILWDMKYVPGDILKSLVSKKAVNLIGFTPTDVLHVLGDYEEFDKEASILGARILATFLETGADELCRYLKKSFALKMAQEIVYFLMSKGLSDNSGNFTAESESNILNIGAHLEAAVNPLLPSSPVFRESVKAFLSFKKPLMRYKIDIPIVLIGGPVKVFAEELNLLLDAEILTPDFFDVGNAVGSLVGKIAKRVDISIRNIREESKYDVKNSGFIVYFPGGRRSFSNRDEALEYARTLGKQMISDYMEKESVPADRIDFKMSEEDIAISKGSLPVVTKLVFEGFAKNVF
jgi:N-methylhydantoinase A/acetone carboxylase, beta subunit